MLILISIPPLLPLLLLLFCVFFVFCNIFNALLILQNITNEWLTGYIICSIYIYLVCDSLRFECYLNIVLTNDKYGNNYFGVINVYIS